MAVPESNIINEYSHIFIPLGVSLIGVIGTLFIYKEKVQNIEKSVEKLSQKTDELRDKVIACETSLKERERNEFVKRKSPLSLTDSGKKLLTESTGAQLVSQNFESLSKEVESHSPKTAYDIQELSLQVLEALRNDDVFNSVKDYAFREGLDLDIIIQVMAIELRDRILRKKGWNVDDIDKHDPTLK